MKRSICGGWRRKIQSMPRKLCGCFTTSMPVDVIRRSFIVCWSHLEKVRPTDLAVRNNFAQISLLLNLNADQAYRLAREVYEQEPKNSNYAATYAFSLHLQGDVKKALQALAAFSEAELEQPQIAAYYGVLLASSGDFSARREIS